MTLTIDEFLLSLGNPGRYQIIASLLLLSNTYPLAFNNFIMVFYGIIPNHHCKVTQEIGLGNSSIVNYTIQTCSVGTGVCSEWDYDEAYKSRSIVSEWDLVCDNKWQLSLGISIYFVGVMIGGIFGGFLADIIGRQPLVLLGIYLQPILGLAVVFVQSHLMFTIIRFFQAIILQSLSICSYTLMMEMLQPEMRDKAGVLNGFLWASSVVITALVAWVLDDWRHVQLALTVPSIISLGYYWFTPESIRWLITQQKANKVELIAHRIARFNKIKLTPDLNIQINQLCSACAKKIQNANTKIYTAIDLVRTKQIRKYTLICAYMWFTGSIVTYSISFALPSLANNIYLSVLISYGIQTSLCGTSFILLRKFGRKRPVILTMGLAGLFCIIVPLLIYFGGETYAIKTISTIAALTGNIFMSFSWTIFNVYTLELYPTVIRSLGQGNVSFFSRLGGIVAPQIVHFGSLWWKPAPFLICGLFGLSAALLIFLLPDTHRKQMPDMIDDVENRDKELIFKVELSELLK